jgi:hypothetical protein
MNAQPTFEEQFELLEAEQNMNVFDSDDETINVKTDNSCYRCNDGLGHKEVADLISCHPGWQACTSLFG